MVNRSVTDTLENALRAAGVTVHNVERRTDPQDSDLIRFDADYYLAIGYDDFERLGVVHVALDQSMQFGGDIEIESWMIPEVSPEQIVAEIVAYEFE